MVTAASSLFTIALPVLLKKVVGPLGLSRTFQILSLFMLVQSLLALSFRPLIPTAGAGMGSLRSGGDQESTAGSRWRRGVMKARKYFNARVFRVATYRVWAFGVATAVLGYMVPYVHLVRGSFFICLRPTLTLYRFVLIWFGLCLERVLECVEICTQHTFNPSILMIMKKSVLAQTS